MSTKQNLTTVSKSELKDYVLQHRDDREAFQTYLDKAQTENASSRIYSAEESVSDALAQYLDNQPNRE